MKFELKRTELKHEGRYLSTHNAVYETKDGKEKVYEVISRSNKDLYQELTKKERNVTAVGMLLTNISGTKILVSKEFRMTVNDYVYNFPGGLVDEGESIETAIRRELKEETGLELVRVDKILNQAVTAVGISNETVMTAVGVADGELNTTGQESAEDIEPLWLTKEEARDLVESGALMSLRTQTMLAMWSNCIF